MKFPKLHQWMQLIEDNMKNARARNAILCGLVDSEFTKVMQCTLAKDMWDKLKNIYEGDDKVKKLKLKPF